ncbi:MAG TPA: TOBE domain-containing protein, partial [Kiloniellaceae bacterium]|nr:TOBE domain-containing protein [Kiloniellaceae bacterium]
YAARVNATVLLVAVPLSFFGASRWGLWGAAIGSVTAIYLERIVSLRRIARLTGTPVARQQDWKALLGILAAAVVAAVGAGLFLRPAEWAPLARLAAGGTLPLDGQPAGRSGEAVTLAVRPERAIIAPAAAEGLPATVGAVVYMGTDTTYHLTLADGTPFVVRAQNSGGARLDLAAGAAVTVQVAPAAVQCLAD